MKSENGRNREKRQLKGKKNRPGERREGGWKGGKEKKRRDGDSEKEIQYIKNLTTYKMFYYVMKYLSLLVLKTLIEYKSDKIR